MISTSPFICRNCGAPLKVAAGQTLALCMYCNCSSRIEYGSGTSPTYTAAGEISAAAMAEIHRLLLDGKRGEAVAFYQREAACDLKDAEQAIASQFVKEVFFASFRKQLLRPAGVAIALALLALIGGSAVAAATRLIPWWLAVVVCPLAFIPLPFAALLRTWKYSRAESASATVTKLVWLGQVTSGNKTIHCFRALVMVQRSGAPFQSELDLLARTKTKLHEGETLPVKFFPGDRSSVLLGGPLP